MLLRDNKLNMRLGTEGKQFVNNSFNPEIIVSDWEHLFEDLKNGIENTYIPVKNHFFNDFKFLRMLNLIPAKAPDKKTPKSSNKVPCIKNRLFSIMI